MKHKRKTKKIITFSDFVKFVKEEAELANDPIFSPDALKKERNKTVTVNQPTFGRKIRPKSKGVDGASGNVPCDRRLAHGIKNRQ